VVEEDEAPPDGAVIVAFLRDREGVTVKRIYRDGEKGRLRPENEGHEELILSAGDVWVHGRVVCVVHPPGGRGAGGGS
jgi:repressor LexA